MRHFVIPARRNSKGLPFKNRRLFSLTANTIPKEEIINTVVSTDDEKISDLALEKGISVHHRSAELSSDTASTTDLMEEIATGFGGKTMMT